MSFDEGRPMDWNSMIENDGEEYTLLDEGDYNFEVTKFERDRSSGSGKLPSCPMAVITFRVTDSASGLSTTITDNLVLHSSLEWKLSSFFRSIGQKKHGEPLRPNWQNLVGSKGRCHVYIDKYTNRDGEEKQRNKRSKYLDSEVFAPVESAPPKSFWG